MRTLEQVQNEINDVANRWHKLVQQLGEGADVTPEITELEEQLDRLYAEKRWLKAGRVDGILGGILEERLKRSLSHRTNGLLEGWAW